MPVQTESSYNPALCSSGKLGYFSPEIRRALTAWTRAKQALRSRMQRDDFQSFVRPMYLVAVLSGKFFLIAIPPNKRVIERAYNFRDNLARFIEREGYRFAGFTAYPGDDQLAAQWNSESFGPFFRLISAKRIEKVLERRAKENARDCELIA